MLYLCRGGDPTVVLFGFHPWGEISSSQPSSGTFSIYFYAVLSAFSTSHPTFASFLISEQQRSHYSYYLTSPFAADILGSCLKMFAQLYPVFSKQERLGDMLMSFPHQSREHAQVRIMWLESLLSLLSDISSFTRQMCQFGYCQCQHYTSLAFWILFSNILPEAIKAELCFGNTGEFCPISAGGECQAQGYQPNLFLMRNNR